MPVRFNGQIRRVNLVAVPLSTREDHCMVLFEDITEEPPAQRTKAAPTKRERGKKRPTSEEQEVTTLRKQLSETRRDMQAIIQDQESATEELQSANEEILSSNEELQSTNEELQTAKEELQSTNEELSTVNEELQNRNAELTQANDDLSNLLASVDVGIVILGSDLRIRHFTPAARKVLNLIPHGCGASYWEHQAQSQTRFLGGIHLGSC